MIWTHTRRSVPRGKWWQVHARLALWAVEVGVVVMARMVVVAALKGAWVGQAGSEVALDRQEEVASICMHRNRAIDLHVTRLRWDPADHEHYRRSNCPTGRCSNMHLQQNGLARLGKLSLHSAGRHTMAGCAGSSMTRHRFRQPQPAQPRN